MHALIWLVAGLVLVAAEALSGEFVLLMIGGGSLVAAATAAFTTVSVTSAAVVFAISTIGLLVIVRPIIRRYVHRGPRAITNVEKLEGASAQVTSTITAHSGYVYVDGQTWSARSLNPGDVFDEGRTVTVMKIDGATAVVWAE